MKCPRCLEEDPELFYLGECRRCLSLGSFEEVSLACPSNETQDIVELTCFQEEVSHVLASIGLRESVFVDAVCGAGKTEVCLELIERCFLEGKRIAWTVPRREVVLELSSRLQKYYPEKSVIAVCQGYTDIVDGDLIVCTTHQLYRYHQSFDVLILDEPDAFPFANNEVLFNMMKMSCKGPVIYLSATFDMHHVKKLTLPIRPSGFLLPVPKVKVGFCLMRLMWDVYKHREEMCIVFVPSKKLARKIAFVLNCEYITSETEDKERILCEFREKRNTLVSTTILERGVTFVDCCVFVYEACHRVFTESSLVQIAGRAMRGMNPMKGDVYFYCNEKTDAIKACLKRITIANHDAQIALKHMKTK